MSDVITVSKLPWESVPAAPATAPEVKEVAQLPWESAPAAPAVTAEPTQVAQLPWETAPAVQVRKDAVPQVSRADLAAVASKHGADPERLREATYWLGGVVSDDPSTDVTSEVAKNAASTVGRIAGGSIPSKLFIEGYGRDDKEKQALSDLRDQLEERTSTGEKAAELGAGLITGGAAFKAAGKVGAALGVGAKAAQTASVVAGGAAQGAAAAKEGEELKGAAIGTAISGGLMAGLPLVSKVATGAAEKLSSLLVARTNEDVGGRLQSLVEQHLAANADDLAARKTAALSGEVTDQAKSDQLNFILDVAGKDPALTKLAKQDPAAAIQKFAKTKGSDFVAGQFDRWTEKQTVTQVVAENALKSDVKQLGFWSSQALKLAQAKQVGKILDSRLGTNVEQIMDRQGHLDNQLALAAEAGRRPIRELALETAKNPEAPELAAKWDKLGYDARKQLIDLGLPITPIAKSSPQMRLPGKEYALKMIEVGNQVLDGKAPELAQDFASELEQVTGRTLKTEDDLQAAFNQLKASPNEAVRSLPRVPAGEAFSSANDKSIPAFVKDTDIVRSWDRWNRAAYSELFTRDTTADLKLAGARARELGDTFSSKYIEALRADLGGGREGTLKSFANQALQSFQLGTMQRAAEATNPIAKRLYRGAAALPDTLPVLTNFAYQNLLGLRAPAAIQNVIAPLVTAVPELGVQYGSAKYLQSMGDLAKLMTQGTEIKLSPELAAYLGKQPGEALTTRNPQLWLMNEGRTPFKWSAEQLNQLETGIKSSSLKETVRKGLEKQSDFVMAPFAAGEAINRANLIFMSKRVAADLHADPEFAAKFLSELNSPAYKRSLARSLAAGDAKATEQQLGDYFIGQHALNYDRINMSQLGRSAGPLFFTFMSWPTATAGKVAASLYLKGATPGAIEAARQIAGPAVAFGLVQAAMSADDKKSPQYQALFGQGGLVGLTPASTVTGLGRMAGSPLTRNPILGAAQQVLSGAADLLSDKAAPGKPTLSSAAQRAIMTLTPGAAILRFAGEDLPALLGHKPPTEKGQGAVEKAVTGVQKLTQ